MVCRCNNEFCFVCLAPWNSDHYSCVANTVMDCFLIEEVKYPKLAAIGLIIFLPIFFIGVNIAMILGGILSLLIGSFTGIFLCFKLMGDCYCLPIIILPLCVIIGGIAGFIWGTFFYFLPIMNQYSSRYLRAIKNLCNSH